MEEDLTPECFDVTTTQDGDEVHYLDIMDNCDFGISRGMVHGSTYRTEGVFVHGDPSEKYPSGWRQYVGKWFIVKVVRNGETFWQKSNYTEETECK